MKATLQLSQSVQRAVNGITRDADSWRRHQSLWKTDKGSVLDKFKAREPSNTAFEEKLSKYAKVRGGGEGVGSEAGAQGGREVCGGRGGV